MKLSFDANDTDEKIFCTGGIEGSITYRERPFENVCLDNTTFEVLEWDTDSFSELFKCFIDEKHLSHGDLVYLRLPADDIAAIKAAEGAGFYFVESSIIPSLRLRTWDRERFQRFIVPLAKVGDDTIEEVEDIAKSTFRGLRFNLDPNIGDERADRRYLTWLRNAYRSGEDIEAIMHHDQIAGFSLLRHDGETTVYRLAGLHPRYKNTGLGIMLYASTTAYCQDIGAARIDGGISMANCSVLNVMANLGYSFKDPTVVFHYYVGDQDGHMRTEQNGFIKPRDSVR